MTGFKFKARNGSDPGDKVRRANGSYTFPGEVVSAFATKSGLILYAVEHDYEQGMIHIFREKDLELNPNEHRPTKIDALLAMLRETEFAIRSAKLSLGESAVVEAMSEKR